MKPLWRSPGQLADSGAGRRPRCRPRVAVSRATGRATFPCNSGGTSQRTGAGKVPVGGPGTLRSVPRQGQGARGRARAPWPRAWACSAASSGWRELALASSRVGGMPHLSAWGPSVTPSPPVPVPRSRVAVPGGGVAGWPLLPGNPLACCHGGRGRRAVGGPAVGGRQEPVPGDCWVPTRGNLGPGGPRGVEEPVCDRE